MKKTCEYCKDKETQCVGCWSYDMNREFPNPERAWND